MGIPYDLTQVHADCISVIYKDVDGIILTTTDSDKTEFRSVLSTVTKKQRILYCQILMLLKVIKSSTYNEKLSM